MEIPTMMRTLLAIAFVAFFSISSAFNVEKRDGHPGNIKRNGHPGNIKRNENTIGIEKHNGHPGEAKQRALRSGETIQHKLRELPLVIDHIGKRAFDAELDQEAVRSLSLAVHKQAEDIKRSLSEDPTNKAKHAIELAQSQIREVGSTIAKRSVVSSKDKMLRNMHEAKMRRTIENAKGSLENLRTA